MGSSISSSIDVNDFLDNWTVQVRKGFLEWCVLSALDGGERYGYELVKVLAGVPGMGLTEGTLYPLLSRLRLSGMVTTRLADMVPVCTSRVVAGSTVTAAFENVCTTSPVGIQLL